MSDERALLLADHVEFVQPQDLADYYAHRNVGDPPAEPYRICKVDRESWPCRVVRVLTSRGEPPALRLTALEQFTRRVSELTITAWVRDGEPVVTMPKSDARKLLRLVDRARELRRTL